MKIKDSPQVTSCWLFFKQCNLGFCFILALPLVSHIEGVFQNRRNFVPNEPSVTEDLRKIHNEDIKRLYSSSNIIRVMESKE